MVSHGFMIEAEAENSEWEEWGPPLWKNSGGESEYGRNKREYVRVWWDATIYIKRVHLIC